MNACVETVEYKLQCLEPDPGKTASERIGPDKHYRPHRRRVERLANAHRVTDDNVSLEQCCLVGTDDLVLERSETGRNSVGDLAAIKQRLHGLGTANNIALALQTG
jgi:hypothetical protein